MRTAAALVQMRALAELVHTRPKGEQCGGADANGEDKISLFFGETVYADEGSRSVGRSAA
jgi:hypothetical protein